ncbi:MAG: hypothetical protein JO317_08665, partial [Verrucomicrobiae bacterium]|nr:hypothetical protein [Verrucomicrobiae bacterium]
IQIPSASLKKNPLPWLFCTSIVTTALIASLVMSRGSSRVGVALATALKAPRWWKEPNS